MALAMTIRYTKPSIWHGDAMKIQELPRGLYRRKESPYIWAKFKVDGMRKPFAFSTETADVKLAEIVLAAKRGAAIKGELTGASDNIGLAAMVQTVIKKRDKSESYLRSAMNVVDFLTQSNAGRKAKDVMPDDIEEYDQWRVKTAEVSTANREIGYLQACYNYAIKKMKLTLEDPVKGFERHDEKHLARDRYLTYAERAKVFSDPALPQNMKDVYMFAMKTGLRQGELRNLKWVDVNWGDKSIKVKTLKKKARGAADSSKTFRYVPLHLYCLDILKRRRTDGWDKKSEFVFSTEDGKQLSRDGQITTALEWACRRHKIENFHYHDFRHTFATDFLRAAHDLKAFKSLSEIMGHSMELMTAKYAHLFPEDKMSQINLLPLEPGFQVSTETRNQSYTGVTHEK